jgi:hypothetical protein
MNPIINIAGKDKSEPGKMRNQKFTAEVIDERLAFTPPSGGSARRRRRVPGVKGPKNRHCA